MESQRKIFKELQETVCMQSPGTQAIVDMCDSIASIFAHGLKSCDNEMSFRAFTIASFPNDTEGLRMASELDVLRTGVSNALKYDYNNIIARFDLDYTVEKCEENDTTELWFHARRKNLSSS